jgi:hypothetical protein
VQVLRNRGALDVAPVLGLPMLPAAGLLEPERQPETPPPSDFYPRRFSLSTVEAHWK